jgi:hypothetical protein
MVGVNLVYVPEMAEVAEFYRNSEHYQDEDIISLEDYKASNIEGKVLLLGRKGYYHHKNLDHIAMLQEKKVVSRGDDLSLVLTDMHSDYRYCYSNPFDVYVNPIPRDAVPKYGNWAAFGIKMELFSNIIMIGQHPNCVCSLNNLRKKKADTGEWMHALRHIEIYPSKPLFVEDAFHSESEQFLLENPSVASHIVTVDESRRNCIFIMFKPWYDVSFASAKTGIVADTDLDVLNEDEMKVDYPWQGGLTTDQLILSISNLPAEKLEAALVSGFTEHEELREPHALNNLSRILAAYTQKLTQPTQ